MKSGRTSVKERGSSKRNGFDTGEINSRKQRSLSKRWCPLESKPFLPIQGKPPQMSRHLSQKGWLGGAAGLSLAMPQLYCSIGLAVPACAGTYKKGPPSGICARATLGVGEDSAG